MHSLVAFWVVCSLSFFFAVFTPGPGTPGTLLMALSKRRFSEPTALPYDFVLVFGVRVTFSIWLGAAKPPAAGAAVQLAPGDPP